MLPTKLSVIIFTVIYLHDLQETRALVEFRAKGGGTPALMPVQRLIPYLGVCLQRVSLNSLDKKSALTHGMI